MVARKLTLELDEVTDEKLTRLAQARGQSDAEIVREAVERLVGRQGTTGTPPSDSRSVYDVLKASGLLGCCKRLPPDLSTNPKYMEGFGE